MRNAVRKGCISYMLEYTGHILAEFLLEIRVIGLIFVIIGIESYKERR